MTTVAENVVIDRFEWVIPIQGLIIQDQSPYRLGLVCLSLVEILMGWVGLCIAADFWSGQNR